MHSKHGFTIIVALFASLFLISNVAAASDSTVKQETGFYYTVKKGDTLWDISKHFFDNPWQWPELWSKNKQIANPHLIYPGNRIRLYEKDGVLMIEQAPPEEETPVPVAVVEQAPSEVKAPEPVRQEAPLKIDQPETPDIPSFDFPWMDAVGFIRKPPVVPDAVIFKVKDDKKLLAAGDVVFVKQTAADKPSLIPGALYTIFRTGSDPVVDRSNGKTIGTQHHIIGIVEITEMLSQEPPIAEAKIIRSFETVLLKDKLMPYKRRSTRIPLTPAPPALEGQILLTVKNSKIFARAVAFINKGADDGVKPGQVYSIFYEEELGPVTKKIDIGNFTVLHTESDNATVVITDVKRALKPETKFRTPI